MNASRSLPYPLGFSVIDGSSNFAIYSETADDVDVCLFDADGRETPVRLTERTGHVFHGLVPGASVGTLYGLRVHGEWAPERGLRHNAAKLLLDPYARALDGQYTWGQAPFGHSLEDPTLLDDTDSASSAPRCVIVDDAFEWGDDTAPLTPLDETVVYEVHVKGFTQLHPDVPEEIRGTYAGLAHPAAIKHLTDLGVTAVELLPVHWFAQDSHLEEKGLRNYWGYNSLGFFAPHADYSAATEGQQQVDEFKNMVKAMHAAGLEVILDVVYNHTAEGNHMGPTLSFKGIDNASYYRLVDDEPASYFDTTGTGNSLNVGHPAALGLIMDSLRYWVTEMHVDGFRFDLATTLTRQDGDAAVHSAFLTLIHQDPVLAPVKMIAEPWDTAGYQVGGFPADWSEWNGKFRDDVRAFWQGDDVLGTFSQRILGSPDIYQADRRSPLASVNFITAHDGFTLADLTSYEHKHNEANGEDNNDGESDNKSFNGGVEGPTDDAGVQAYRDRQRRNLIATVLLSAGVPMLLGGDEIGRSQGGNNNAYCQDNEISWFDWAGVDADLLEFTTCLIGLRRDHRALRPSSFRQAPTEDVPESVEAVGAGGDEIEAEDWTDPHTRAATFVLEHDESSAAFALLLNSASNEVEFVVPPAPHGPWELASSSDPEQHVAADITELLVRDASFTLLVSHRVD
jgi:isoamylase